MHKAAELLCLACVVDILLFNAIVQFPVWVTCKCNLRQMSKDKGTLKLKFLAGRRPKNIHGTDLILGINRQNHSTAPLLPMDSVIVLMLTCNKIVNSLLYNYSLMGKQVFVKRI